MLLVQMGASKRLIADTNVWACHDCGDCSSRCPAIARPGKLMGALRAMSVESFAFPRFIARAVNRPSQVGLIWLVSALLVLAAIAIGGSFHPQASPVLYASMFPHLALNLFFTGFTALGLLSMIVGMRRAWRLWMEGEHRELRPMVLIEAFFNTVRDLLSHRNFSACGGRRWRKWAHIGMFFGFFALFLLAGVAALSILLGMPYPFPALHPLKIFGNLAGLALCAGVLAFMVERGLRAREGERSPAFDWLFLGNLFLVGLTGFVVELGRFAELPALAYPTYAVHLVSVFVLLVFLPYSKLAHAAYRVLALTVRAYRARGAERGRLLAAG